MQAGRELDALVAKHVMELNPTWNIPNEDYFYTVNGSNNYLPYYSTSIADAWQVVEEMIKRGASAEIFQGVSTSVCSFNFGDFSALGRCDSAPLAICLAALDAVGVNIEKAV